MRFFQNDNLIAFISTAGIDFTPQDFNAPLTPSQQQYILKETGSAIPQVFWRKQIHGDDVLSAQTLSELGACPDADAYVTDKINLPLAIRTADCVPVFLYDPVKKVIGLAHAGWKGTHKEIAAKTVGAMKEQFASNPQDILAAIGPSIRPCCYEVGAEFKGYFPADIIERNAKLYADVVAVNKRQLLEAGLKEAHITDSGVCTCCSQDYFSFRRDGAKAGRMISVMMLT